uniref:Uncharacterized protein n=1 Tax=Chromera velia CCMP2878 TaxID=1169474 RepID=A0A0G4G1Z7_9ALVE|eukprot:Cvel_19849.t1-p1 / transcript=Cvel_19849.t1 / gene=Cvel_19849 / organism=Chromera_velia_CCMP2878 / gene_product=hypothetical protein / transcript_product=hypothetical protein / location=Cvel_scaffold1738:14494-15201(-) / protein_length=200 / sequence_SO=supercontig / SO=protein_coding / is_pseudo=false
MPRKRIAFVFWADRYVNNAFKSLPGDLVCLYEFSECLVQKSREASVDTSFVYVLDMCRVEMEAPAHPGEGNADWITNRRNDGAKIALLYACPRNGSAGATTTRGGYLTSGFLRLCGEGMAVIRMFLLVTAYVLMGTQTYPGLREQNPWSTSSPAFQSFCYQLCLATGELLDGGITLAGDQQAGLSGEAAAENRMVLPPPF